MKYYPITLIAFNRPYHTFKTLEFLSKNPEAINSNLHVFIDGPRSYSDIRKVNSTEQVVNKFRKNFKNIFIKKSIKNKGLVSNVVESISEVLEENDATIVLEDDIQTSIGFLNYMNRSLENYKNSKNVWHISGYNIPRKFNYSEKETFFIRLMFCWGWGTWKDRWKSFNEEIFSLNPYYIKEIFSPKMIKEFNLNGNHNLWWSQIEDNASNKNETWAIFWYAHIFLNKGLCLNPVDSLCLNNGLDGSGQNCNKNLIGFSKELNKSFDLEFPENVIEDKYFLVEINRFFNYPNLFFRILKVLLSKIKILRNKLRWL